MSGSACRDQGCCSWNISSNRKTQFKKKNTISPSVWGVLALFLAAQSKTSPFNPSGLDLRTCFCSDDGDLWMKRKGWNSSGSLSYGESSDSQPWWEPGGRNSASTGSLPFPAWWCPPQQQLEAPAEILEPPGLP